MPMTSAQSYCTEAARAAALASHSAASLAAAAGFREAARLLRSSEALARAATAALLALPRPTAPAPVGVKVAKKRSRKKKNGKKAEMEGVVVGPALPPPAVGVPVVAPAATTAAAPSLCGRGKAGRVLAAKTSRERSPRGSRIAPSHASHPSSPLQVSSLVSTDSAKFAVGRAVVLKGLIARVDLEGKRDIFKSFDSTSLRYAVCIID